MKSRTSLVTALAILLAFIPIYAPKLPGALYAEEKASQQQAPSSTPPDASAKPADGQSGIRVALPKGKKLILKDGSFQLAREYSVDGDRVRYWSVERSDWEEIPTNLVDWDATHKAEAEQASQDAALKAKIHASEVAERTKDIDVDRSLEIKPGLFLPDAVGFYALDTNKMIYVMKQSTAGAHLDKGRAVERIITGVPFIPARQTLEIPDEHAALRLTTTEPEFFMRPSDSREPRFRLIHAQIKGGRRFLESVSTKFTGEQSHNANEVDIQTWTPATGVFRYTVEQRLAPGEYAFVEMTSEGTSGYVWDFGVDAPATKKSK
jgi:hypothetical protein